MHCSHLKGHPTHEVCMQGAAMGALVFSLPQRNSQRTLMPKFCIVDSAREAAVKIAMLEMDPLLVTKLRTEASQSADMYLRAPSWRALETQLFSSRGSDDDIPYCTAPSRKCRTRHQPAPDT